MCLILHTRRGADLHPTWLFKAFLPIILKNLLNTGIVYMFLEFTAGYKT